MLILLNQWISFGEDIVLCVLLRNTLKGLKSMLHMMNPALLSHQVFDIFSFFFFFFFFFGHMACGLLVPWPGIEPGNSAVKARSPNHWTTREFPLTKSLDPFFSIKPRKF